MIRQAAGVFVWLICPVFIALAGEPWLVVMLISCCALGMWDALSQQYDSQQKHRLERSNSQAKVMLLAYIYYCHMPYKKEAA